MKKMISFEIEDELREELRVEAFHRNTNISACIRQILEDYFKALHAETTINTQEEETQDGKDE